MDENSGQAGQPHSSLVPTHETNGFDAVNADRDYNPSVYERYRHGHWQSLRRLTYRCLQQASASEATLKRFAECGSNCQVSYSPSTKRLFLHSCNCKNRHCKPCADAKRNLIAKNLHAFCGNMHLRMILLTIAHHNRPLPDLITRMHTCFKLLRKEEQWKANVDGYAAFTEVKWSERSDWWHVHIHILCSGQWWDRRDLQATWHKVTGDSMVTDIREVTSDEGISYTAKYAAKPFSLADVPAEQRVNAIVGVGARRLWQVGGSWKGKLKLIEHPDLPADVEPIASFTSLVHDATYGDATARTIIDAIVGGAAEELVHRESDDDFPDG